MDQLGGSTDPRRERDLHRGDSAGVALGEDAQALAATAYAMAERFHRGGKLLAFGYGGAGTDASHVAVEFMHPVIVGKPALAAIALSTDGGPNGYAEQVRGFADATDIALGLSVDGEGPDVRHGLAEARELGLLTIALLGGDGGSIRMGAEADHILLARDPRPGVVKEVHVTMYHLLWELVHVLLEQPAVLGPRVFA